MCLIDLTAYPKVYRSSIMVLFSHKRVSIKNLYSGASAFKNIKYFIRLVHYIKLVFAVFVY